MRSAHSISFRGRTDNGPGEVILAFRQLTFVNFNTVDFSVFNNLQVLRITTSRMGGVGFPPTFGDLSKLQTLSITDSDLGGQIPASVCTLGQLQHLSLIGTQLTGPSLCANSIALIQLRTINLSNNKLSGELPDLHTASNLAEVTYDNNRLDGNLSPSVLPPLVGLFHVRHNLFTTIDSDWTSVDTNEFYISYNELTGTVPKINAFTSYNIDFSHNHFDTWIYGYFETECPYTSFDASYNDLGGAIPNFALNCFSHKCDFAHNPICNPAFIPLEVFENCGFSLAPTACCSVSFDDGNCLDCNGVPFGTDTYDSCDICGGDGTLCFDCAGVPFGTSSYDICGVCDGDDSSCQDCQGVVIGSSVYDACDVCNGDGTSCADCSGAPHGPYIIDGCGKCVLPKVANLTCEDCKGVVNGTSKYDEFGDCNGHGRANDAPLVHDLENSEGSFWWLLFLFFFIAIGLCMLSFAIVTCAARVRR